MRLFRNYKIDALKLELANLRHFYEEQIEHWKNQTEYWQTENNKTFKQLTQSRIKTNELRDIIVHITSAVNVSTIGNEDASHLAGRIIDKFNYITQKEIK